MKKLEYVQVDARNAILFTNDNTRYIKEQSRLVTQSPDLKPKIYAEIAKKFALDPDRVNSALVQYVNKIKGLERSHAKAEFETDLAKLCRKIGHKFVDIKLSHLRAYRECLRCGKVATKYKISAR